MSGNVIDAETVIFTVPDPGLIGQSFDKIIVREGDFTTLSVSGVFASSTAIDVPSGGTGQSSYAVGDILYASAPTVLTKLPVGANGTVLTVVGGVPAWTAGGIPPGCILMWSGTIASIPAGWALCDGTLGTPNLLDRFIVGAGLSYPASTTGGFADAALVAHTHTFSTTTDFAGNHVHSNGQPFGDRVLGPQMNGLLQSQSCEEGAGNPNWLCERMQAAGQHSHGVNGTTASAGIVATGRNLPPYWALAYIMKL